MCVFCSCDLSPSPGIHLHNEPTVADPPTPPPPAAAALRLPGLQRRKTGVKPKSYYSTLHKMYLACLRLYLIFSTVVSHNGINSWKLLMLVEFMYLHITPQLFHGQRKILPWLPGLLFFFKASISTVLYGGRYYFSGNKRLQIRTCVLIMLTWNKVDVYSSHVSAVPPHNNPLTFTLNTCGDFIQELSYRIMNHDDCLPSGTFKTLPFHYWI